MEWVETTAKTVAEAQDLALDELGVLAEDAEFEIVEEPKPGLFGRVRGNARVKARVRPTAPPAKQERGRRKGRGRDSGSTDAPGSGDDSSSGADTGSSAEAKGSRQRSQKAGSGANGAGARKATGDSFETSASFIFLLDGSK